MTQMWNLMNIQTLSLYYLQEQYCMWADSYEIPFTPKKLPSLCESIKAKIDLPFDAHKISLKTLVKRRTRRGSQLDISSNLRDLLSKINNGDVSDRDFQDKIMNKSRNPALKRSSKFIGVSRNGDNWQAMINNGRGKNYIGTYSSEKEAGIAYDIHCFAIHQCSKKTNFSYNVAVMEKIICDYFENDKILDASKYMHLIE
jgi:hypothetical protein